MALHDKDILITPNRGQSSDPKIEFKAADATIGPKTITLNVYPASNGTLSFEGSAGQLFSITNELTGTIFSVNDISGIPSIEVQDTGLVKIAQYSGNVLLGTGIDNAIDKLQVNGSITASQSIKSSLFIGPVQGNASTATTANNLTGFTNSNSSTPIPGPDAQTSNGIGYVQSISLLGQVDGALYSQAYSTNWVHQIYGDYRTGQIALRGKNNGTWQSWRTVIDTSNYNTYVPTLTGGGASGTWGISVTGSAATAAKLTTARTITLAGDVTGSSTFDGSANISITATVLDDSHTHDSRYYTEAESDARFYRYLGEMGSGVNLDTLTNTGRWHQDANAESNGTGYPTARAGLLHVYGDNYKYQQYQTYDGNDLYFRTYYQSWSSWKTVLHNANYNNYSPTLTGGGASGTWGISITGSAANSDLLDGRDSTHYLYGQNQSGSNTASTTQNSYELAQYKSGFWDVNGASWTPNTEWWWGATFAHTSNSSSYNYSGQLAFKNGGGGDEVYARTISGAVPSQWSRLLSNTNYNSYAPTLTGGGASGTWGISITGSAATLTTGRTIGMTGDVTWTSAAFNGSANVTGTATLANSGVTAGTYTKVTTDAKGRVTAGSSLVAADIPNLDASKITSGTFAAARIPTGISITGNAATATALQTARTINGVSFDGTANITINTSEVLVQDTRSVVQGPSVGNKLVRFDFVSNSTDGLTDGGTYHGVMTFQQWTDASGGGTRQLGFTDNDNLWIRGSGTGLTSYGSWKLLLNSANYNTYAPTLTGGGASGTWGISITGSAATLTTGRTIGMTGDVTWTSAAFNGSANVTGTATLANSGVTAGTYGSATTVPVITVDAKGRITSASTATVTASDNTKLPLAGGTMTGNLSIISGTLERTITLGSSGAYLYGNATTYGVFKSGGGHLSFNVTSGDLTASGNVTAYSDIRLKTDLEVISDAISKVKKLTGYTYTRIDTGSRQTGLVAQDVKKVLPEAVEYNGSHLSLAYGNLVGLLVEAIKEQQAQIDKLTHLVMKG